MLLQEVFDQLACAELNNISVVDQTTKMILPGEYGKVATAINAGLTQLHTRFLLREGTLQLVLHKDQSVYQLSNKHVILKDEVASAEKYIRLAPDFRDNLLKIHTVSDDCGRELNINVQGDRFSIREINYDTLVVDRIRRDHHDHGLHAQELLVRYRQNHKMIPAYCDGLDPECYGLTLPRSHLWALCLFVAARMHIPVGLQDATYTGNSFMALFNSECDRLEYAGLQVTVQTENLGVLRKNFP